MPIIVIAIIIIFVSLLGPIMASYFSAQIMRETGLTTSKGERSQCDHCHKQLEWWELIPLFSYIFLRGKCSKCGKPINPRMFFSELIGLVLFFFLGVLAVNLLSNHLISLELVTLLLIQLIMIGFWLYFAIYDVFTMSVPTKVVNWAVMFSIAVNVLFILINLTQVVQLEIIEFGSALHLVSGLVSGLAVYTLIYVTKEKGIGIGDLYLAVFAGLMLGWPGIVAAFYVLIFSATTVGLTYAFIKKQYKGLLIPLIPFMALGYAVAMVWTAEIIGLLFIQI